MESRAKILGHAIHPMLIVFPLGLLTTAVVFDIIALASHLQRFAQAAYYMLAAGVIGGVASALFGAIDWVEIQPGTRAKTVGIWHGLLNLATMGFFLASFILRETHPAQPPTAGLVLSFVGFAVMLVSGWLGGELVERHGVSVDNGANLNAPSSLRRFSRHHEQQT